MADLKALKAQRSKAIEEAQKINDLAVNESRDLDSTEQEKYDKFFNEAQSLKRTIDREVELREEQRELAAAAENNPILNPDHKDAGSERELVLQAEFRDFLRGDMSPKNLGPELRGLQADADVKGGYIVAPGFLANAIIKEVDNMVHIRGLSNYMQVNGINSLGVPSLDSDPEDGEWTSEIKTVSEDEEMEFGQREFVPHPLTKLIKVSEKLLMNAPNTEALVEGRLGYKFGVTLEKAYMTGSGAQQALGVFTASDNGIPTSRDVSTDNGVDAVTADGLRNAFYSVNKGYRVNGNWIFHRDGVKMISKLKDGEGQYIWKAGIADGAPDTLLGKPILESEYAPNTFTTGLYAGIFGDFNYYWIVDSLQMQIRRLDELFALTNQVGFKGMMFTDGMPVLGNAFARVKLA